jgi:hypothetical protein
MYSKYITVNRSDWSRLPRELRHFYEKEDKKLTKKRKIQTKPNLVQRKLKKENLDLGKLVEVIQFVYLIDL